MEFSAKMLDPRLQDQTHPNSTITATASPQPAPQRLPECKASRAGRQRHGANRVLERGVQKTAGNDA
jgi:hypothetical protein